MTPDDTLEQGMETNMPQNGKRKVNKINQTKYQETEQSLTSSAAFEIGIANTITMNGKKQKGRSSYKRHGTPSREDILKSDSK